MNYLGLRINFNKPDIWRRPTKDKLPKQAKTYFNFVSEITSFDRMKEEAKEEITKTIKINIERSKSIDEMNRRLDELFAHYGKAVIPDPHLNPEFLLKKTNQNTLNKKLQGWCKNLVFNIPEIIDTKPYKNLRGKFRNIPAFVCLAGPSLRNNRKKLKEAKGKSLIIAVDTSLRPLLDVGVTPDIVVTHDANPNGCKFFLSGKHPLNIGNVQLNGLGDEQLGQIYTQLKTDAERLKFKYDTVGIFVNYCHPLTLLAFNGLQKCFYGVNDPALPVYDTMVNSTNFKRQNGSLIPENKGRVVGGSSVGHVAIYIAVQLGCNPINFLGLDLSYPRGKSYIEGASNQKDITKLKLIDMEDLSGNKVKTNLSMLSYKMVFERSLPAIIMQTGIKFFNCTEDDTGRPSGILEVGAEPQSLSEVIQSYCNKPLVKSVQEVLNNGGETK